MLLSACRYIQLLKDNTNLQLVMGLRARAAVENRTIEHVVKDLLEWYHVGIERRGQRSYCSVLTSVVLLLVTVPIAIIAFFIYNLVSAIDGTNDTIDDATHTPLLHALQ